MTTTHYHAGWNMVGYLPEMDAGYPFEDWESAKGSMIDDLERECDSLDDMGEHDLANELSGEEQSLNLITTRSHGEGVEWGTIVGNISYWIVACVEEECLEEEEYAR